MIVIYQLVFVGVRHGMHISFIAMIIKDNFDFLVRPCTMLGVVNGVVNFDDRKFET